MREVERRYHIKPRGQLRRTASGGLRPADEEADIADIWAEQRRIRLAENIAEQQRRAEKKQRRKEQLHDLWRRGKGRAKKAGAPRPAHAKGATKEIEIKIGLPKLGVPKARLPRPTKKQLGIVAACLVAVGLALAVVPLFGHHKPATPASKNKHQPQVSSTQIPRGTPSYATVLPVGKTIDQLGGWGRVSPPGSDPVWAYADSIDGTRIDVSEQPLPESFKENTAEQVAQLAQQYSATEKLTVDALTVYIGTSAKGPQSLIFTKGSLLILVKSVAPLTNNQWASYISSLQ